ncbi:MAG: hypothetical protein M3437_03455 [Chloroflexota bacterium]|nr:hypothetical protein [Chloroflexota bacterium]MDQ5866824.1 hypothetical protein [Chloroflexota bacterium]
MDSENVENQLPVIGIGCGALALFMVCVLTALAIGLFWIMQQGVPGAA